jgi:hypothetical protein
MKYLSLLIVVLGFSFSSYAMPAACDSPANLTVSNVTSTGAIFSWDNVAAATYYEYSLSTSSAMPPATGVNTTNTSVNAQGMASNTTYYFCLRSKCGMSSFSSWVCTQVTTLPKSTTSVNVVEKNAFVNVFPNPATNMLTFESPNKGVAIRVTNVIGKVMHTTTMNTTKQSLDISQWPSGIYPVKCMSNNDTYTIKVVKE